MDLIDAAVRGDLVLLLAIIVVALAGSVTFLFKLLLSEKDARVKRSEKQFEDQGELFDRLESKFGIAISVAESNAKVAKQAADLAQATLDELRRRP